jgi:O-antigen/teichoic acid export membrane protein
VRWRRAAGTAQPATVVSRIVQNTFYLAIADVVNKLMMFGFYMVAARHLGVERFGTFSFALAFVSLFSTLTDLGLGGMTSREIARDHGSAQRLVSAGLAIKLIASLVVIAAIITLAALLGYPRSTVRVVAICSLFVLESAFVLYYMSVFQGFERMEFTAIGRIPQTVLLLAGGLVLARGPATVEMYALLYVGCGLVGLATISTIAVRRFVPFALNFSLPDCVGVVRAALPFGLSGLLVTCYYWNGSALLSKMSGDAEVGIYSAPLRLVMGMAFAGMAFAGAMYPVMSRVYRSQPHLLGQIMGRAVKYMLILVLPIGLGGLVLADRIVPLIYGNAYLASIPVLRFLLFWCVCACLSALFSNYLFANDRARFVTVQSALSVGVNVLFNLALIPRLRSTGAAAAILVAEAAGLLYLFAQERRATSPMPLGRLLSASVRTLGVSMACAALARLVGTWNVLAGVAAGALVYLPALFLVGALNRDDARFARQILQPAHAN